MTEPEPMPQLSRDAVSSRILSILETQRQGDFTLRDLVSKALTFLRENEPDLLQSFAEMQMQQTLYNFYRKRRSDARRSARRSTLESQFRAAVEDVDLARDWFSQDYLINNEGVRRTVADMTGADHAFVASRYQASGQRDLLLAAFHRNISTRVGNRRTADVMTEAEYERAFTVVMKGEDGTWGWA